MSLKLNKVSDRFGCLPIGLGPERVAIELLLEACSTKKLHVYIQARVYKKILNRS